MSCLNVLRTCLAMPLLGACSVTANIDSMHASRTKAQHVENYGHSAFALAQSGEDIVEFSVTVDRDLHKTRNQLDLHHYYVALGECTDERRSAALWEENWETLTSHTIVSGDDTTGSNTFKFHVTRRDLEGFLVRSPIIDLEQTDTRFCVQLGAGAMWGSRFWSNQLSIDEEQIVTLLSLTR